MARTNHVKSARARKEGRNPLEAADTAVNDAEGEMP